MSILGKAADIGNAARAFMGRSPTNLATSAVSAVRAEGVPRSGRLARIASSRTVGTAAVLGGMGAAINSSNPVQGAIDMGLDLAFTTPTMQGRDADNVMLGYDIKPLDIMPKLPFGLERLNSATYELPVVGMTKRELDRAFNPVTAGYVGRLNDLGQNKKALSSTQASIRSGGTTRFNSSMTDGSMVFGMWNSR